MNEKMNQTRVGIYTQKSTEVTAVGDGLASKRDESPVTEIKYLNPNEANKSKNNENIVSEKVTTYKDEDQPTARFLDNGSERDKLNKSTELKSFPKCEEYYGKERWDKALQSLKNIGYMNWEINIMFTALDTFPKTDARARFMEDEEEEANQTDIKKARLDDESTISEKPDQEVISGILLNDEEYSTFDLRANIGDANHPNFHILPENRTKFYLEFHKFLSQDECFQDNPIVCSYFVNHTLMIECKNEQVLEQIVKKISGMNHVWPDADIVMIGRSSEREKIQICIPYPYSNLKEILKIIKEQNRLPVEKWKVNNCLKLEDSVCLQVEVDGGTYLRLIVDQEDIFFLMKKATIKLHKKRSRC